MTDFSAYIIFQVLVPKNENLMGKMVTVQIMETGKHFLKGRLLSDKDVVRPDVPLPLKKGQVSGAPVLIQVCRVYR
jgi:threonylcarbamoyladenosine tRNA methylthiotransferase CDKAL1